MKRHLTDIASEFEQARLRLIEAIKDLPDSAEGAKILGKNCCSVPLSLIGQQGFNLSPRYWLTRETKTQLTELVENSRGVESLITSMEAILATRKLKDGTRIPFNVVEALRKAWEGE
jgi:hypothetical protein